MKSMINVKWMLVVAVALLCLAPGALAQQGLELVGVNGNNYDGIYIGPYDIQVGGSSGPTYGMICDDFNDEIYIGSQWQANPVSVNASTLGQTLYGYQTGNYWGVSALGNYEAAAALSYAILFGNQGATSNAMMQYAIWAIFNPSSVYSYLVAHDGNPTATWATITGLIAWAQSHGSQSLLSEFIVWTPQGCGSTGCPGQEFFEFVPEGGAALMYLLLAGLSCVGAMFFRSRNQRANPGIA